MHRFAIINNHSISKIEQIVFAIKRDIEKGVLAKNSLLPSINVFSKEYKVARDTIEKAYNQLKEEGLVGSRRGKGYFVIGKADTQLKVLLIFNKLSSYKRMIYDAILETLGKKAKVDLQIHFYNPRILKDIIASNLGKYHYYVVMPHFFLNANKQECKAILQSIPDKELILLDKNFPGLSRNTTAIYQDFENDIFTALHGAGKLLKKYHTIELLLDESDHHPQELKIGIKRYCQEQDILMKVTSRTSLNAVQKKTVYIVTTEDDLALVVKQARMAKMELGKDIGIISFNESVLKELLDITVVTTNFKEMGVSTANCILKGEPRKIVNPFSLIQRGSL
jgi:DNA-binding transcriptional regulator YhcF (GntR family)